ncbi:ABC transporter ATP-binding protein OS=Streptomyces antimycoticus OX=68175 GN=SANT12839_061200 PE=4 SV=1 [Streptomyces antimycoticus]
MADTEKNEAAMEPAVDATPNVTEVETVDAATEDEAVAALEAKVDRGEPILARCAIWSSTSR